MHIRVDMINSHAWRVVWCSRLGAPGFIFFSCRTLLSNRRLLICPTKFVENFLAAPQVAPVFARKLQNSQWEINFSQSKKKFYGNLYSTYVVKVFLVGITNFVRRDWSTAIMRKMNLTIKIPKNQKLFHRMRFPRQKLPLVLLKTCFFIW